MAFHDHDYDVIDVGKDDSVLLAKEFKDGSRQTFLLPKDEIPGIVEQLEAILD